MTTVRYPGGDFVSGLRWEDSGTVAEALTLSDPDPHAANTEQAQDRVGLRPNGSATVTDGTLHVTLPPVSWTAVSLR